MYINKAILYGNLTRDPEPRAMPSGMNVANFSIATNRVFNDKDGKKQQQTDFHSIVVFGRQADIVSQYLKKGSGVFIEGHMQTRSWDDKKPSNALDASIRSRNYGRLHEERGRLIGSGHLLQRLAEKFFGSVCSLSASTISART